MKIFRHIFITIMVVLFIQVWRSAIVPADWQEGSGDRGSVVIEESDVS